MPSRLPDHAWVARFRAAMSAVTAAYREGDYETALAKTEDLKDRSLTTAPYCFFRGSMLHHLGRFEEAEASLREGLFLERNHRQQALAMNTLASVLMDQTRFAEAIEFYERAGRAWPDRGAAHRGIAEVSLRQCSDLPKALLEARRAVEIDEHAEGMPKEILEHRLGEDLAVLAWALAANSADASEVESTLSRALQLCSTNSKPALALVHYHAGRAYSALQMREKSEEHFRQAAEIDRQGICGRMARTAISKSGQS